MSFKIIRCPYCGNEGHLQKRNNLWYCNHCGNSCTEDNAETVYERIKAGIASDVKAAVNEALFKQREEQYYNLRSILWEKVNAKYIDSAAIVSVCNDIKKIEPHDFLASFFEIANSATPDEIVNFINSINVKENGLFIDLILDFMIRSLRGEYVMSLSYLIERAYKDRDLNLFERHTTRLEAEAEKVEDGIYSTLIPRDVFIAYSSKDIDKVIKLTSYLESNGLSCFVAMRNLQHGRGAVANYRSALREAIDNSKMIVFVSSRNSRSLSCDALTEELRYIRSSELSSAPPQYRNSYAAIPYKFKKPRIQYRIDNTPTPAADAFISEFFSGLDYCESDSKVLSRISEIIFNEMPIEEPNLYDKSSRSPDSDTNRYNQPKSLGVSSSSDNNSKYCKACGTSNLITSKFCSECGGKDFSESKEKYCTSCESKNPLSTKFCTSCGANTFAYSAIELTTIISQRDAKADAERKAKEATAKKIKDEEARRAELQRRMAEEQLKAKEAAALKAKAEAEQKAREDAERKAKEEADLLEKKKKAFVINDGVLVKFEPSFDIEDVVIPDGVKTIGDLAFKETSFKKSIRSIVIPDSVEVIGQQAFSCCLNLKSVSIGKNVSLIGEAAFDWCSELESFEIPEKVTVLSKDLFRNCSKLRKIIFHESVTTIEDNVFNGCNSLRDVKIPDSVTKMGSGCFANCGLLSSVTLSKNIKEISKSTFFSCDSLFTFDIPDWITTIGDMAFYHCKNLRRLNIPESVTTIGEGAFSMCKLLNVYIPSSVSVIKKEAFQYVGGKVDCETKKRLFKYPENWDESCFEQVANLNWGVKRK